ncbi:MAG TPA: hypothetical protein VNU44_19650 [Bryobacteraceae bacterium]|nr:hypothetical protein [Bryobacteraceae bacterium]
MQRRLHPYLFTTLIVTDDRYCCEWCTSLCATHSLRSKQGNELVDRKACIPDNGAQQWLFDTPAGMNRHHRSCFARGVNQYEVASLLTILDESGVF